MSASLIQYKIRVAQYMKKVPNTHRKKKLQAVKLEQPPWLHRALNSHELVEERCVESDRLWEGGGAPLLEPRRSTCEDLEQKQA